MTAQRFVPSSPGKYFLTVFLVLGLSPRRPLWESPPCHAGTQGYLALHPQCSAEGTQLGQVSLFPQGARGFQVTTGVFSKAIVIACCCSEHCRGKG